MFIQTQETPNPNSLKFFPGRIINKGEPVEYKDYDKAIETSWLAAQLLKIHGITNVMFNTDYITISKEKYEWQQLKPIIIDILMSYFLQNEEDTVVSANTQSTDINKVEDNAEYYDEKDSKIVEAIKELLDTHIRTAVARDGGDIQFRAYKDGVVYLTMHGACAGCPSANATLKQGVENLLRHFIPQIVSVEAVE